MSSELHMLEAVTMLFVWVELCINCKLTSVRGSALHHAGVPSGLSLNQTDCGISLWDSTEMPSRNLKAGISNWLSFNLGRLAGTWPSTHLSAFRGLPAPLARGRGSTARP